MNKERIIKVFLSSKEQLSGSWKLCHVERKLLVRCGVWRQ